MKPFCILAGALAWLCLAAPVHAQQADSVRIGGRLADVELHDVSGNYSTLSSFVGDGKYLLVCFWTANCPRCHASFVELKKYHAAYADRLRIIGVMLSDNHDGWMEMYQYKQPFPWPNLSDGQLLMEGAAVPYNIRLFPTFVLVDPEGTILRKWSGFTAEPFRKELEPFFPPVAP